MPRSSPKKSTLTLDAAINILVQTFDDPWKTDLCASRLHMVASRIEQELMQRQLAEQIKFAQSQAMIPFLRSGMRLLTRNYSRAEYNAMTTHLMICRCNWADQKIRDLHCPGDQGPTGKLTQEDMISFRAVVRTVVDCINFALSGMTTGKFRSLDDSAAQHGSVKPWPWDLHDLFPSGNNAELMTTLTRWAAQGGGFYMFRLANSIAKFYPSFVHTLVQDPKLEFALQRPLIDITTALDRYERDPNEAKQEKEGETSFTTAPLNIIFEFFYIVIPTLEFQYGLMVQSLAVIPVISRLRRMLPSFPAPPGWSSNIDAGCEGLLSTAKGKTGEDEGEKVGTLARTRRDSLDEALGELVVARKSGGCLNLECPKSADTYARLCSKCDVVRYCGPECQKQAWKVGIWPHKTLCKKIFFAREQLGPDAWAMLFTDGVSRKKFSEFVKDKEIDLNSLQQVESELYMMRKMKHRKKILEWSWKAPHLR